MNMKGITAMMAAAAFTGLIHTAAAQENVDSTQPNDATSEQNAEAQKTLVETFAPLSITPPPAVVQSSEKFLTELKVYPTF